MTKALRVAAATALVAAISLGAFGCAAKEAVKTVVEQGVEPTSTGPTVSGPANNAQDAVDGINNTIQQTQDAQGTGQ